MFFISNPSLRKLEAFMQETPNFPPKGMKLGIYRTYFRYVNAEA